jgi:hypothetical protein
MPSVFSRFIQDITPCLTQSDLDAPQVERLFQRCIDVLKDIGYIMGDDLSIFSDESMEEVKQVLLLIRKVFDKFTDIGIEKHLASEIGRIRPFLLGALSKINAASRNAGKMAKDEKTWFLYQDIYQQNLVDCHEQILLINRTLKGWQPQHKSTTSHEEPGT